MLGSWFAPLLIHNHNQQTAMMRAAAARAQGLDPEVYGVPLPGSNVTTTVNNTGGGLVKGAVLAAIMLVVGALGAAGLGKVLSPKPTTSAAPAPAPTGEDEYEIPWTVKDGKIQWGTPKKVSP